MAKGNKPKSSLPPIEGLPRPKINFGGRPPVFDNVEEFDALLNEYFTITPPQYWTITGVYIHLGLHKATFYEYAEKPMFADSIKKAQALVEQSYEFILKEKGHAGSIFGLKNFGWKDKQEQEVTHHGLTLNLQKFTPNSDNNDNETRATE